MAKNVIIRRRRILPVYHFMTCSFKNNYSIELNFSPRIQIRQTQAQHKIQLKRINISYAVCLLFFFWHSVLTRGIGHSNQKHKFGPVKPNSHNKCKILNHSENRIAEELYYIKSIGLRFFVGSGDYRFYAGSVFYDTHCS